MAQMRERVWMVVWAVSAVLPRPGGLAGETQNLPARYATIPA